MLVGDYLLATGWLILVLWATICKMVRPILSDRSLSVLCVMLVYCGQMVGWIKMPLHMEVGLSPCDIVLDGDPAPPKKGTAAPHFLAHVYCGQTPGWIKMPLSTEVGLGPGDIVLDRYPARPRKGHCSPPPTFWPTLPWHSCPSQLLLSTRIRWMMFTRVYCVILIAKKLKRDKHGTCVKRTKSSAKLKAGLWS